MIWEELAAAGLPCLATETHRLHEPHVSLTVAEELPVAEALAAVGVVPGHPLRLEVAAAGVFPAPPSHAESSVLFLACVGTQELFEEHRRVHCATDGLTVGRWAHYEPETWTPHMTLGVGYASPQLAEAMSLVLRHLPVVGLLDGGGVEDGTTGERWPAPTPS